MMSLPVRFVQFVSAAILGVLVVAVFANVVLRFVFNSGFVMTEEVSRILLVWLVFGGAIVVLHSGRHISMTMAVERLSQRAQIILAVVSAGLMVFCDALLLIGAWRQAGFAMGDILPVSGLPAAIIYVPGIVGALAFAMITLWRAWRLACGQISSAEYYGYAGPDPEQR